MISVSLSDSLPFFLHSVHCGLPESKAFQTHFLFIAFTFMRPSVWDTLAPKTLYEAGFSLTFLFLTKYHLLSKASGHPV